MKPKHHRELASFYALELIRLAAAKRDNTTVPVDALLLGNWFTDVSQLLLGVRSFRLEIRAWLLANVDQFFDKLKGLLSGLESGTLAFDAILEELQKLTGGQPESLRSMIEPLLRTLGGDVDALRRDVERRLRQSGLGSELQQLAVRSAEELSQYLARARRMISKLKNAEEANALSVLLLRLRVSAVMTQLLSSDGPTVIDALRKEAAQIIDFVFPEDASKAEHFENIIRSILSVWGYFEYVHPEHSKAPVRFPFDIYLEIRDRYLVLTFSHDHCDRPPSTDRTQDYDVERDMEPTLYGYLREDRELISGLLYEVEKEWAYGYFERDDQPIESNRQWHLGLAKLGRALHAVQDYYAHTTFVEHARSALNAREKGEALSDTTLRRLKRWLPECRGYADLDDEPKVVSGYFDGSDAGIAVLDFVLDAVGYERTDPMSDLADLFGEAREIVSDPLRYGRRRIRELAEIAADPQAALEDITNELAQTSSVREILEDYGVVDFPRPSAPLADDKLALLLEDVILERVPPAAATWISTQVLFLRDLMRYGKLLYAYASLVMDILSTYGELTKKGKAGGTVKTNTIKFLSKQAGGLIVRYLGKAVLTRMVDNYLHGLGSERIGCHSLLSKDGEDSEYFEDAMKLAAFTDAYIVGLMVRAHRTGTSEQLRVTKWEEVLEYFLNHPLEAHTVMRGREIQTTTDVVIRVTGSSETPTTLAQRFAATSKIPREDKASYGYTAFDWKVIADRNFGTYALDSFTTQWIMSEGLKEDGVPRRAGRGGMYAFRPGALVVVPYQALGYTEVRYESTEIDWWMYVTACTSLREIKDAFTAWFQDESRKPLGISYMPSFHTFDRRSGETRRVFVELNARIAEPAALRTRLRRDELAAKGLPANSR